MLIDSEPTPQSPRTQNNNGASRAVPFVPAGLSRNQYICFQIIVLLVQLDLYSREPIARAGGLEAMPQPGLLSSHCHCSRTAVLGVIVRAASYLPSAPSRCWGEGAIYLFLFMKFASLWASPDKRLILFALPYAFCFVSLSWKIFREEKKCVFLLFKIIIICPWKFLTDLKRSPKFADGK